MKSIRLGARMLAREARAGELTILAIALVIAVASVTAVGFFTDRLSRALTQQAAQLLGADLLLIADHPLAQSYAQDAVQSNLSVARSINFLSMVSAAERSQLAELKAVSEAYPLRGRLRARPALAQDERQASGVPARGSVWASEQLARALGFDAGAELQIGAQRFNVSALLTHSPDQGMQMFNLAPRVLMNEADLAATKLVQPGSRISYRLLVAGESDAVNGYRARHEAGLGRGERMESVRDARPEARVTLERAQRFLGLAALLAVVLAAVAIALAARRYMERHYDACAMMRCLGATQNTILTLYLTQMSGLALAASAVGCALGFASQFVLSAWLARVAAVALPLPSLAPALQGIATGFVLLIGFVVPPLLRLRRAPTIRVIRREVGAAEPSSLAAYVLGAAALALLIVWRAQELKLAGFVAGGFALALLAAAAVSYAMLRAVHAARGVLTGATRIGAINMARRTGSSIAQTVALSIGIMAILLLTIVRSDLLEAWRAKIPSGAPNRFLINVQPDQVQALREFFQRKKLAAPELYPMVRGRLVAINDQPVAALKFSDRRSKRLTEREFNLSWMKQPRADNVITAGRWWSAEATEPEFSAEQWIATELNLKLGDRLAYDIAGTRIEAALTSIRKVDWDSFRVNFYMIGSPGLLEKMPASYVTSFHVEPANEAALNELVQAFPNLTLIDVGAIMREIKRMTQEVSRAVEFVFLFTLAAGLLVLYAAIAASQHERALDAAIMRTLGATNRQLVVAQLAEFALIGFSAGVLAALGASALAWVVSERVLELDYRFSALVPIAGALCGAAAIACAGLMGTRSVMRRPPLQTIRAAS